MNVLVDEGSAFSWMSAERIVWRREWDEGSVVY